MLKALLHPFHHQYGDGGTDAAGWLKPFLHESGRPGRKQYGGRLQISHPLHTDTATGTYSGDGIPDGSGF